LADVVGQLHVVAHRLQRARVAVEADVAHACRGHHAEDAVHHHYAGPQDVHQRELLAGEPLDLRLGHGRGDHAVLELEVAHGVERHEHAHLGAQGPEVADVRLDVPHDGELVLDEWVIDDRYRHVAGPLSGPLRRRAARWGPNERAALQGRLVWRRGWDSNPRCSRAAQRSSRPSRSTTPAPLQVRPRAWADAAVREYNPPRWGGWREPQGVRFALTVPFRRS